MADSLLEPQCRGRSSVSQPVAAARKILEVAGLAAACVASVALYDNLKAAPAGVADDGAAAAPVAPAGFLGLALGSRGVGSTMPVGVNLGGWLILEDWFYSSTSGRHVMSARKSGQGACFPPAVPYLDEPWPSEGVLTQRLVEKVGEDGAAAAFVAHRHSFIGEQDLRDMAGLGIRKVRVPISWAAFADALAPINASVYGKHNPLNETAIVPDPFYTDLKFATIPRDWIKEFVGRCATNGLQVMFDIHSMPGGSSDGTYNGVWPAKPRFWQENATLNKTVPLTQAGLWIAEAMVRWIEELEPQYQLGIAGVSLMNEPAHMAAADGKDPDTAFINNEEQVLDWLAAAADIFRTSELPKQGSQLYVQIIETAFKDFLGTVGPWYKQTFTMDEQTSWAVMDRHWYAAWSGGACDGRTTAGGGYFCDEPIEEIRTKVQQCIRGFTEDFAKQFPGLKATSEFSMGTYEHATFACNDRTVRQVFLEEQLIAFEAEDITPFFWTWRMPYGKVFEPGWSLKHLAGLETDVAETCLPGGLAP